MLTSHATYAASVWPSSRRSGRAGVGSRRGVLVAGRYRLKHLLGPGARSDVWLAYDEEAGREVAVKLLSAEGVASMEQSRLERDVLILGVPARHRPQLYGAGRYAGRSYVVSEVLAGETLAARLERQGPLAPQAVADLARQLLGAIAEGHALQIAHGAVRPSNVFLCEDGAVKVIDWGVARLYGHDAKLGDSASLRADIYGVGEVLHQALTGRPFEGAFVVPPRHGALGAVMARCLAARPQERPSAHHALVALGKVCRMPD